MKILKIVLGVTALVAVAIALWKHSGIGLAYAVAFAAVAVITIFDAWNSVEENKSLAWLLISIYGMICTFLLDSWGWHVAFLFSSILAGITWREKWGEVWGTVKKHPGITVYTLGIIVGFYIGYGAIYKPGDENLMVTGCLIFAVAMGWPLIPMFYNRFILGN
jgi:hypothetical protein